MKILFFFFMFDVTHSTLQQKYSEITLVGNSTDKTVIGIGDKRYVRKKVICMCSLI